MHESYAETLFEMLCATWQNNYEIHLAAQGTLISFKVSLTKMM